MFFFDLHVMRTFIILDTLFVIRFMTVLLRKYRGSVVIIVGGEADAEPTMFTTDPLFFHGRSVINPITILLHRVPLSCAYFTRLGHFKMASLLNKILTSLVVD